MIEPDILDDGLKSPQTSATSHSGFNNFAFPLIRSVVPDLFVWKTVQAQPMSAPSGLSYALKELYGEIKEEYEYELNHYDIIDSFTYKAFDERFPDKRIKNEYIKLDYFKMCGIPVLKSIVVRLANNGMISNFIEINDVESDQYFIGWAFKKPGMKIGQELKVYSSSKNPCGEIFLGDKTKSGIDYEFKYDNNDIMR